MQNIRRDDKVVAPRLKPLAQRILLEVQAQIAHERVVGELAPNTLRGCARHVGEHGPGNIRQMVLDSRSVQMRNQGGNRAVHARAHFENPQSAPSRNPLEDFGERGLEHLVEHPGSSRVAKQGGRGDRLLLGKQQLRDRLAIARQDLRQSASATVRQDQFRGDLRVLLPQRAVGIAGEDVIRGAHHQPFAPLLLKHAVVPENLQQSPQECLLTTDRLDVGCGKTIALPQGAAQPPERGRDVAGDQ